jgi:hypothetical protein
MNCKAQCKKEARTNHPVSGALDYFVEKIELLLEKRWNFNGISLLLFCLTNLALNPSAKNGLSQNEI